MTTFLWMGFAIAAVLVYAACIEPNLLRITRHHLSFPNLPQAFDGFHIVHLADIHCFRAGKRERRVARMVKHLRPDIIVCTGDLFDCGRLTTEACRWLAGLDSGHGVFMTLGNHDVRTIISDGAIQRLLEIHGVKVLRNEFVHLHHGQESIGVVGTADPHYGKADIEHMSRNLMQATFNIALAHSPDVHTLLTDSGVDLVLCGHTHGGQVCLPLIGPVLTNTWRTPRRLCSGLSLLNVRTRLIVSRGVGIATGLPFRFLCRPEVVFITLKRSVPRSQAAVVPYMVAGEELETRLQITV